MTEVVALSVVQGGAVCRTRRVISIWVTRVIEVVALSVVQGGAVVQGELLAFG